MILTIAALPRRSGSAAVLFVLLALGCSPAVGDGGAASGGASSGTGATTGGGGSPTGESGGSTSGGQDGSGGETATDPAIWINSKGKVEAGSNSFGIEGYWYAF